MRRRFNPRAREGRDAKRSRRRLPGSMFQSTRPRGARRNIIVIMMIHICFNPRAREGRDVIFHTSSSWYPSFNPRAREGRDLMAKMTIKGLDVSIHAPARGATSLRLLRFEMGMFQSTRPRGARLNRLASDTSLDVSIHAPARGATLVPNRCSARQGRFNPRAREGRDKTAVLDRWRT